MKAAGGATFGHSGFDYSADSLTQSSNASKTVGMEVETSMSRNGKRKRCEVKATRQYNNLNQSGRNRKTRVYDDRLLANGGDQKLVGLSLNLGKRLGNVDHIGPFLANLNQNGRVKSSWNGTFLSTPYRAYKPATDTTPATPLITGLDERMVVMQVFRHRLSQNYTQDSSADPETTAFITGNTSQTFYPGSGTTGPGAGTISGKPHVLFPANTDEDVNSAYMPQLVGAAGPPVVFIPGTTVNNAFYKHTGGQVSFVPINRPDLEDMSWNLNKLKLSNMAQFANSLESQYLNNVVPSFLPNMHRRQSVLQQNNFQSVSQDDLGPATPSGDATTHKLSPYIYKACLRYGTCEYEIMNKNDTGCHVEFIVYKIKKTADLSAAWKDYSSNELLAEQPLGGITAQYPLNRVIDACGQGYINTVGDDWATENLQGRPPNQLDIYSAPSYPLLPTLRKTVASTQPVTEVMRNKFAMPSGSRRTMTVKFPGELYNPTSIRVKTIPPDTIAESALTTGNNPQVVMTDTGFGPQMKPEYIPIVDEYSYCVVIAVNGQKMTRFYETDLTTGTSPSVSCPAGTAITAGAPGYPGPGGPAPWSFCYLQQTNPFPPLPPVPFDQGQIQPLTATPLGWLMVDTTLPEYAGWSSGTNYFWCEPASAGGVAAKFSCELVFMNMVCAANDPTQTWWNPSSSYYCIPPGWDVNADGWPWASMDNLTPGNPNNWPSVVHAGAYITDFQLVEPGCGYQVQALQPLPPWDASNGFPRSGNSPDFLDPTNVPYPLKIWEYTQNPPPYLSDCALQISVFLTDTGTVVPGTSPAPPKVYPMGDNYGNFHVDYCATYTEHLGACVYEPPSERNLYDCGQPAGPALQLGDVAPKAQEHSRLILPAKSTVRQGPSTVANSDGTFSATQGTYTAGGA